MADHAQDFRENLARVRELVGRFEELTAASPGRPPASKSDILRAAVVLLHGVVEELVRGVVAERLPTARAEAFGRIPFFPETNKPGVEKLSLSDLARFRGRTVDEVIQSAVGSYLDRSNYNHPGDLERTLKDLGIDLRIEKPLRDRVAALTSRRHHIAHRLDRDQRPHRARGRHKITPLSRATVESWLAAVDKLGHQIIQGVQGSSFWESGTDE